MRLMYTTVAVGVIHWNTSPVLRTRWRVVEVWKLSQGGEVWARVIHFRSVISKLLHCLLTDNRNFEWDSLIKDVHRSNLMAVNRGFGGRYCICSEGRRVSHSSLLGFHFNPEDGDSIFLRND
jgi:hypothetical protein